jgi:hypothetical protein
MNWRPIKTAPKDEFILLKYNSCERTFVHEGRWIEVPHFNQLMKTFNDITPPPRVEPGWRIGYIAIQNTDRDTTRFKSWEATSMMVWPSHWMPLPKP